MISKTDGFSATTGK